LTTAPALAAGAAALPTLAPLAGVSAGRPRGCCRPFPGSADAGDARAMVMMSAKVAVETSRSRLKMCRIY
ncbi:MAG: hypothetical protein ACRDF0_03755, partial [Candidatus Limnocylindria bacterium]